MKIVKLFDDYLNMAAAQQNMSREEYTAHYLSEKSDHEVGMAQGQLEAIVNAAMDLQDKIGGEEINLPGWIQAHITSAYEYLKQANDGYHELDESKESDALAKEIDKAMIKIDDSMSYKDFAIAVATVLRDEYGQHNYKPFMEELKKNM